MIMDIIRGLSSANLDIRKKTLEITLSLVVPNNIGEVMQVLKKEVQKTQGEDGEKNAEYRGMLLSTLQFLCAQGGAPVVVHYSRREERLQYRYKCDATGSRQSDSDCIRGQERCQVWRRWERCESALKGRGVRGREAV